MSPADLNRRNWLALVPAFFICALGIGAALADGVEPRRDVGAPPSSEATYATHTIEIVQFKFVPAELTVQTGDHIIWVNMDAVPHTATANDGWDSGLLEKSQTWEFTAGEPGLFNYICTFHPVMKGVITVE